MAVTTAPVLMSPQDSEPFRVEVDSLDFATGVVLSQQLTADGKWHPVAFYSKSLSSMERNYEIHDKEMLAVICVLKEWRHFLEGATHPIEIWTDHKNLEYFMTAKKLNRRQACWSLHLTRFDFLLHHCLEHTMGHTVKESQSWKWSLRQREHSPPVTGIPCGTCSGRGGTNRRRAEDLVQHPQGKQEWRPRGTYS